MTDRAWAIVSGVVTATLWCLAAALLWGIWKAVGGLFG